jgi:hypothetical protein
MEVRITVLARASSNLAVRKSVFKGLISQMFYFLQMEDTLYTPRGDLQSSTKVPTKK